MKTASERRAPVRSGRGASAVLACGLLAIASGCGLGDAARSHAGATLTRRWFTSDSTSPDESTYWPGLPTAFGDRVLFAVHGGLAAYDTATGHVRWRAVLFSSPRARPTAMNIPVRGDTACIADYAGIGCVDARTGRVLWAVANGRDSVMAMSASAADAHALYYGTRDHHLAARSLADGTQRWSTDLAPGAPFGTPVFSAVARNDTVFATTVRWRRAFGATLAGDLVAVDARSGRILWRFTPADSDQSGFDSPVALADGLAAVSDVYAHAIRVVDLAAHRELWHTPNDPAGYVNAERSPIVVGDTIVAASSDEHLYAFDLHTGKRLWRIQAADGSLGSVSLCPNAYVVVLFPGGDPHVVDRRTLKASRAHLLERGDFLISGAAAAASTVYAGSLLGAYAFECRE